MARYDPVTDKFILNDRSMLIRPKNGAYKEE